MKGLLNNPASMSMLLGGLGLLTAKKRSQADKWKEFAAQGLLSNAQTLQKQRREDDLLARDQPLKDAQLEWYKAKTQGLLNPEPKQQRIIKGADGFNYFEDGRRVLPDVVSNQGALGNFKDTKEMLSSKQATRSAFDKATQITNKVLDRYQYAANLTKGKSSLDDFTGADDTVLMKAFANMVLPTESVMGDDLNVIARQEGLPSLWHQYAAQIEGEGQLGVDARRNIYATMANMVETARNSYDEEKRRFSFDVEQGGFDPASIFRQSYPELYKPAASTSVTAPNGQSIVIPPFPGR